MAKFAGWVLSRFLRGLRRTWRVRIEGRENLNRLYAADTRLLLCFWHGKYVPIFPLLEGYKACIISSRSERGDIIAEICRNFGYQSVQIPDHGRHESLSIMTKSLSEISMGGTAVDGPLGPRHRVKSGVIRVASALGFALVPISVASRRKIVFEKRWDRMEIPLPFTTVCLVIGDPIKVPPELHAGQVRDMTDNLAETIETLAQQAERIAGKEIVSQE